MNYSTIIFISLMITSNCAASTFTRGTVACSCDEVTVQADCPNYNNCEWVSSACQEKAAVDCTAQGTTVATCNKNGCALNSSNTCETKATCSTYAYEATETCLTIGCDAETTQDATTKKYKCKDFAASTNTFDGTKACSTYTVSTDCNMAGCKYTDKCEAWACTDLVAETQCKYIRTADSSTTYTICSWSTDKCIESTTGLTETNCASYSSHTLIWNKDDSTCSECSGSFAEVIAATMIVMLALY